MPQIGTHSSSSPVSGFRTGSCCGTTRRWTMYSPGFASASRASHSSVVACQPARVPAAAAPACGLIVRLSRWARQYSCRSGSSIRVHGTTRSMSAASPAENAWRYRSSDRNTRLSLYAYAVVSRCANRIVPPASWARRIGSRSSGARGSAEIGISMKYRRTTSIGRPSRYSLPSLLTTWVTSPSRISGPFAVTTSWNDLYSAGTWSKPPVHSRTATTGSRVPPVTGSAMRRSRSATTSPVST